MRKNRNKLASLLRIACLMVLAAAILLLVYHGGRWLERRSEKEEVRGDYTQRYAYDDTVELNGATYRRKKNLTTVLLMGVDTEAEDGAGQGNRNGGQADFLRLVVIDDGDKAVTQIQIDRDTMTPITVLGVLGNRSGMRTAQISLSHGFGDGKKQSCELTAEAVSNLLLGVPVDHYIAMNLDGIATLNDMLGGVTVALEDDFSALDPSMTAGTTLTLMGDQAEIYVRSRRNVGVGTNEARMARQEEYLSQLSEQLYARVREDKNFIGTLYDALSPYLVTNLSRGRMINEAWAARDYAHSAAVKLDGRHEVGSDGFMQFYVNETALETAVIELFYRKIK